MVRVELRNEALETHYINHIELMAVSHPPGAEAVPDQRGRPVVVAGFWPATPAGTAPFVPGEPALLTALSRWHDQQYAFEVRSYSSPIGV